MKTKLEQINFTADWEMIQKMTEGEAKHHLYKMASLSSSLMYELFMLTNYGAMWKCQFDELFADRYIKAMKQVGVFHKNKEDNK